MEQIPAYRLFQRGDIDNQLWNKLNEYYRDRWLEQGWISKEKHSEKDGGPSYYVLQKYRLGSLVRLVQRLVYANTLTTTKAAMLLDVKSLKLHRLFDMG